MKEKVLHFVLFLFAYAMSTFNAQAQEYRLYINDFEIQAGETQTVSVILDNGTKGFAGFQTDIALPQGLSLVETYDEDEEATVAFFLNAGRKKSKHDISYALQTNGAYRVLGGGNGTQTYTGTSDTELFNFQVTASANFTGTGTIRLFNTLFTDPELAGYNFPDEACTVSAKSVQYTITAVSSDETMGSVTGGGSYKEGASVTLTATPKDGYKFVKWSDDTTVNPYIFNATKDMTITAFFASNKVVVSSISVTPSTASLTVGDTQQLSATVSPSNATNKNVTWSSGNTSVATVSSTGLVTAKAAGTVTIKATAADGSGVYGSCTVTVKNSTIAVSSISVTPSTASLSVGTTKQLSATVSPSNATNKNVTWSSGNTSVATVSSTGLVTAKAAGTVTIKATAADGSGVYGSCTVTIKNSTIAVSSISVTPLTASLTVGGTKQLSATVSPSNATNKNVTWSSDNTSVATVSSTGLVTAKAAGTVTIKATAADGSGVYGSCTVTVKNSTIAVSSISVTPSTASLSVGTTKQLSATVSPSNATNKNVTWSSGNTSVATVSSTGLVTAKAAGTVTIKATASDGSGVYGSCTVTVKNSTIAVSSISITPSTASLTVGDTKQLSATVSPSNATNKNVTWSSGNTSVATVSSTGLVTAKAAGTVTIKATASDGSGVYSTCIVSVTSGPQPPTTYTITAISANTTMGVVTGGGTYEEGKTVTLTATPKSGYRFVKWSDGTNANPYIFKAERNVSLIATFAQQTPDEPTDYPSLNELVGAYVEDTPGPNDGTDDALVCCSVDIVDTLVVNKSTGIEYNVGIKGFCQGFADVVGKYDPKNGTITIPQQYCYLDEEDSQVTLAYLTGITQITKEGYNLGDALVLKVEKDKKGFYITLDPEYEVGWGIVCEKGSYAGYIIVAENDLVLNPASHMMKYSTFDLNLPEKEQSWESQESYAFVEDLGDELVVHGFVGQFVTSLTVKGDKLTFRTGQKVYYTEDNNQWFGFYTFDKDGKFLCSDTYECPVVVGESGTIYYGSVNKDGNINWDYLCIGYYDHNNIAAGGLWSGVEYGGIQLIPWKYQQEGVNTVLAPTSNTNGCFNLQGRRVDANAHGLIIQQGKKVLKH